MAKSESSVEMEERKKGEEEERGEENGGKSHLFHDYVTQFERSDALIIRMTCVSKLRTTERL